MRSARPTATRWPARLGPERLLSESDLEEMIASLAEARVLCGAQNRLAVESVLAECHLRRGDVKPAHGILRDLVEADPDDADLQLLWGDVLAARGETPPARGAWQRAATHPRATPRTVSRARERLARGTAPYR